MTKSFLQSTKYTYIGHTFCFRSPLKDLFLISLTQQSVYRLRLTTSWLCVGEMQSYKARGTRPYPALNTWYSLFFLYDVTVSLMTPRPHPGLKTQKTHVQLQSFM